MNPILKKSLVTIIKAISLGLGAQGVDVPIADGEIDYWVDIALMLWPVVHSIISHVNNQRTLEQAKAGLL